MSFLSKAERLQTLAGSVTLPYFGLYTCRFEKSDYLLTSRVVGYMVQLRICIAPSECMCSNQIPSRLDFLHRIFRLNAIFFMLSHECKSYAHSFG